MQIPLSKMDKDYEVLEIIRNIIESGQYVNGPHIRRFEHKVAELFGIPYAVAVNSGTSAIYAALLALGIKPGDEIIVPSMTFFATVAPILAIGAVPVFIDIDPLTICIDVSLIEALVTPKTKAILPVHLYGYMAEMPQIIEIAQKHNLFVIEDACQAHGAKYVGKFAGSFGDLGCFSLYPSKNLTVFGQGGLVVTKDANLANRLRAIRDYGQTTKNEHKYVGLNFGMSEITAAFGELECDKMVKNNARRVAIAEFYAERLRDIPHLTLPVKDSTGRHVYHLFVVRLDQKAKIKREELRKTLERQGIQTGVHYPKPVHAQDALISLFSPKWDLPQTNAACSEVLSLPMSALLTNNEVEFVCNAIRNDLC
jgi:dTDP-4-amino-4,6-dideoxygalactose transaminase